MESSGVTAIAFDYCLLYTCESNRNIHFLTHRKSEVLLVFQCCEILLFLFKMLSLKSRSYIPHLLFWVTYFSRLFFWKF